MPFLLIIILILSLTSPLAAEVFSISGYCRDSALLRRQTVGSKTTSNFDNFLTARQNLKFYPVPSLTLGVELRERLCSGQSIQTWLAAFDAGGSSGYFKWRRNFADEKKFALTGEIDRLWLDCEKGNAQLTFGRQRIAWGTNLVWNPLDIFNPSSPLDFENEEKPGGDAARLQIYTSSVAKVEAAVEARRDEEPAAAALIKQNAKDYDLYFIAGRREGEILGGMAWAGDISDGGFRGETLFRRRKSAPTKSVVDAQVALSGDYTFHNSLYLHSEVLYNSAGVGGAAGGLRLEEAARLRLLSPARWSLFGEIAGNVNPLARAGVSGILNPDDHSYYLAASFQASVFENVDFSTLALILGGESGTEFGEGEEAFIVRLKWSF